MGGIRELKTTVQAIFGHRYFLIFPSLSTLLCVQDVAAQDVLAPSLAAFLDLSASLWEGTSTYCFPCGVQLDRTILGPPIGINLIGGIGATGIGVNSWSKRTIVIMARLGRSRRVLPEP
jgi:hypothetical protein